MNTNLPQEMPEDNLPRVSKQIEASWQDAQNAWRDNVAREFERSVCLPLLDALKSISDSYKNLQEEFADFSDATDCTDFYRKSASLLREFRLFIEKMRKYYPVEVSYELLLEEMRMKEMVEAISNREAVK